MPFRLGALESTNKLSAMFTALGSKTSLAKAIRYGFRKSISVLPKLNKPAWPTTS